MHNGTGMGAPRCVFWAELLDQVSYRRVCWTYLICLAKCSLLVKLSVQGGYSVQKNLWPFFFFVDLPGLPSTLSFSDPSWSPSESSISTSCDPDDWTERCELPLRKFPVPEGVSGYRWAGVNGASGRGRCPESPTKEFRVGVFGDDSSTRIAPWELFMIVVCRGVAGGVSSPARPTAWSSEAWFVLTARNPDMSVRWTVDLREEERCCSGGRQVSSQTSYDLCFPFYFFITQTQGALRV